MYFRVLYNSLLGEMIDIREGIRCIHSSPNSSRYCRNLIRPDIVLVLVVLVLVCQVEHNCTLCTPYVIHEKGMLTVLQV